MDRELISRYSNKKDCSFKINRQNMIRNSLLVILFAFTGLCHICCDSSESLLDDPSLKTDLKSLNFEELASSKEIEVMCNVEWEYYFGK